MLAISACGRISFEPVSGAEPATDAVVIDVEAADARVARTVPIAAPIGILGSANIFGAGLTIPPAPGGNGAGELPPSVELPVGTGRILLITEVTGTVSFGGTAHDADGDPVGSAFLEGPYEGLSAYWSSHNGALTLVFLDDSEPAAPPPENFESADLSYPNAAPLLRQLLVVGDGRTDSGVLQQIFVPDEATRVFFGISDSGSASDLPGSYGDNSGMPTLSGEFLVP